MTISDCRRAFIKGWEARDGEDDLADALAQFERSLRKRKRRWFRKPKKRHDQLTFTRH